ncbi:MAG: GspH/FimT family pseudopilin [Rhodoferax sp.]|uniref:GspH/FimT family pseudopilin n=1 Tax=Rhodoferax sp. TaxID=50421 RepID=UPI003266DC0F
MFVNSPHTRLSRSYGFTLIELLVTIAIVGILAALAAPSLRTFIVRNTFSSIGNEFSGSILRARNEAVSKNMCVSMCMSDTVDTATPFCTQSSSSDWQVGWIVFMNPTCSTTYGKDAGTNAVAATDMLLVRRPANPEYVLNSQRSPPTRRLQFNARGSNGLSGADEFDLGMQSSGTTSLTFAYGFNICLDPMGRTRSIPADKTCGNF